jgi:hypothetical protein
MRRPALVTAPLLLTLVALAAGCGGSSHTAAPSTTAPASTSAPPAAPGTTTAPGATTSPGGAGALQAEANAAAAGDIPDNQVFLTFHDPSAGFSMKYPEGWAQRGSGRALTLRDKNNIVRVLVQNGSAPAAASVRKDLHGATLKSGPQRVSISGAPALKVVYSTVSAPNPVTGKRVTLVVDRYYLWHAGKLATVDLGTPVGVDNVDAYRMMIESFRWR